ncbi:haloacid dehalogenase (HAD) superfamily protein [Artemisia annua]|uniref:Haloacid dehalogenase (HAD) superfamily protein n=1 Tax=Artemisia annua TaxID=35608 RepID=A0A2U1ND30_ARTAN|nr:haloacid dehalogenase (HAD) superfamily protein [Artemisia annua]
MLYTTHHHITHSCFFTNPIKPLLHKSSSSSHHQSKLKTLKAHYTKYIFYTIDNNHQHHQNNLKKHNFDNDDDYDVEQFYKSTPIYLNDPLFKNEVKKDLDKKENMWWADIKAAIGQRINVEGLMFSVSVITKNRNWVMPHLSVKDIRYIDWAALKSKGYEGVVFDKDNTLTVPYSLSLWGPISESVESCKAVFGSNVAVFSNSAGLEEYDPDGRKARALEFVIGIRVIRHKVKKPAGSAEEIEKHFGCDSSKLIMVRKIELALVNSWSKKGLKPANQRLLPDALDCVKELPPM